MTQRASLTWLGVLLAFVAGIGVAAIAGVRADADNDAARALERLVRVQEAQERRLEQLVRATEKCHR